MFRLFAFLVALQAFLSVRTVLVALPVTVTDGRGHPVSGLLQDNFAIYEDGRRQPITVFDHSAGAVTLGLVVDHSQSMSDNLPRVIVALSAFADVVLPDDEMFVVDFNEHVSQPRLDGQPFTHDARALSSIVARVPAAGQTALYDAIIAGLEQLQHGRWDKRTLVVVSDGGDNASRHSYADVREMALRSQAQIYAIGLRGASAEQAPKVLKRLCADTGGVAYFPRSPAEVSQTLRQIVRDLREQYTLGFSPGGGAPSGVARKILVTASAPGVRGLHVRTRTEYLPPGDQP